MHSKITQPLLIAGAILAVAAARARAADPAFAEVDRPATEFPLDAAVHVVVRNAVASARAHLRGRRNHEVSNEDGKG